MKTRRWSRRTARVLGSAALALAAVAAASSSAASAAVTAPAKGCCHLLTESAAVGWGNNFVGQLGDGINLQVQSPNWTAVSGLTSGVVQVSAGNDFAVGLTSDGSVWAWGANLDGGTSEYSDVPVQVPGLVGVVQVSAGTSEGVALRSDGTVWTWGDNHGGDLGNGTTGPSSTPVQVSGLTGITQVSAGDDYVLALRSDGTVWAWGQNDVGELGNGTTNDSSVPVQVMGLSRVTAISAGGDHAMALATKGYVNMLSAVYGWGGNGSGQIGDGTYRERPVPVQVNGIGPQHISAIAAGGDFSMVLGSDGSVWDWGDNFYGQLGDGNNYIAIVPVQAQGPGTGITQISAGANHALALLSNGTVQAWGYNGAGQLGNGTYASNVANPSPVQVTGLGSVTQISAGANFSLAVHQVAFIQLPGSTKRTAT